MLKPLDKEQNEIIQFMSNMIENLNKEHNLKVRVAINDEEILPSVSKPYQIILFNKHFLPWIALWQIRDFDLYCALFLTYRYFCCNEYLETEKWLELSEKILKNLIKNKKSIQEETKHHAIDYELILKYQALFSVLHEYAHILFYKDKEYRKEFVGGLKDQLIYSFNLNSTKNIEDIDKELEKIHLIKERPWNQEAFDVLLSESHNHLNQILEDTKNLSEDEQKIEEIASDVDALFKLMSIFDDNGYSPEEQTILLLYIAKILYCLEMTLYWRDILGWEIFDKTKDNSKDESLRQVQKYYEMQNYLSVFRYSVFFQTISLHLESLKKGCGLIFERQFSMFDETERYFLPELFNRMQSTIGLLGITRKDEDPEIKSKLLNRITNLEQSIFNLAESHWKQTYLNI